MYNAELYIGNCLDSILNSDLFENQYEILVINDGSVDRGPDIVQKYLQTNQNITYLTQENQGQSTARNYGIRESSGEYVWFVDADDIIDAKAGEIIKRLMLLPNIDILGVQLRDVSESFEQQAISCEQPTIRHNTIIKGRDAILEGYNPSSVCALVTRTKFLVDNNLFFIPGITHQDVELSYRMMAVANMVYFSTLVPYIYIQHPVSVRHNPQKQIKYNVDNVYVIKSFRNLADSFADTDSILSQAITNRSQNVLWGLVFEMFRKRKVWKKNGINQAVLSELKSNDLYPIRGSLDSFKKRLALLLLNREYLLV